MKKGDRVKLIKDLHLANGKVGDTGTIISDVDEYSICVEFDKYIGGHDGNDLDFKGKDGHCWWVDLEYLEPLNKLRFTIGDRVAFKRTSEADYTTGLKDCMTGTVKGLDDGNYFQYHVEFDENIGGHGCAGECANGHGQNVKEEDLIPVYTLPKCDIKLTTKGDNKMEIINIYKEREITKINKKYDAKEEKIKREDANYKVYMTCVEMLKPIFEEQKRYLSITEPEMSKDTLSKLEKVRNDMRNAISKLNTFIDEVNAQLSICENYDQTQVILKRYNIIDDNGKINA